MVEWVRWVAFLAVCLWAGAASGQVPSLIHQEGLLVSANGLPLEGTVDLRFSLYAAPGQGAAAWTEAHDDVALSGGYYSVILGSRQALTAAIVAGAQYLQLEVDGQRLDPRTRLVSVPFALLAQSVRGGPVDATTVLIGGNPVIDINGRWVGNPAGLQGPQGPAGPVGPQGPAGPAGEGGGGGADTPQQILDKLRTLQGPLNLTVANAADAARFGGRLPGDYLRKSEAGVDIANGGLTVDQSTVVFKSDDVRNRIAAVQGTATIGNDAQANALVVAGRRGANENERRIELRGLTTVVGNMVTQGSTVLQGGLSVTTANGVPRPIIDAQGRWVPNANPLAGNECPAGQAFRGVAEDGQLLCQAAGNALAGCGIPIPCDVPNGWGQFEYDEEEDIWSACLTKACYDPARLVVPDPNKPWTAYCRIDENTNERCQDGIDNDGDRIVDCNDPDCIREVAVDVCELDDLEVPMANPNFDPELEEGPGNEPLIATVDINNPEHGRSFGVADAPQYRLMNTVSALTTQMTLDRVPVDLTPGDDLLVIALRRNNSPNASNIGRYEVVQLAAINNTQIVLSRGLRYYYDGVRDRVMVQRIPTYRHVTVRDGGVLTARGWDGLIGGVFAMRVVGTLRVEQGGVIDMAYKGFGGARSAASPAPAAGAIPPLTVGQADNFDGLVTLGGGNGNIVNGGGVADANGRGGNGGTCPARVPVVNPQPPGVGGQGGGAGQACNSHSNNTYLRSGGGGAPRNPGRQPTTLAGLEGRVYLGGGGANGAGGGGSANWTSAGNTACRGQPGRQDGGAGAGGANGCSSAQASSWHRGGPGGNGASAGHGGGIVLIWADTIQANNGVTIRANGAAGGAGGGGGGGGFYSGGGGGGAGGGGAGGGVVMIRATVRTIGAANIDVSGGQGGGGGGGGGSGDGGVGGAGAGQGGGGGGPGIVTRQSGCAAAAGWPDPAAGGNAGQAGADQNGDDDTVACQIFNGAAVGSFPTSITRAPCLARGGAIGGGGGGGGLQENPSGGANQGGQIAPPPPAPGPFCHQFTTGGVTYENQAGANAPGRDGGNANSGRQFTAGGGGGRRGPDGANGVKLIAGL